MIEFALLRGGSHFSLSDSVRPALSANLSDLHMNLSEQLRESRSKHSLKSHDAALRQLKAFKAVQPVTSKKFYGPGPLKDVYAGYPSSYPIRVASLMARESSAMSCSD